MCSAYSGVSYFDSVVLLLDQSIKQEALNNLISNFKPSYIFQNTSRTAVTIGKSFLRLELLLLFYRTFERLFYL